MLFKNLFFLFASLLFFSVKMTAQEAAINVSGRVIDAESGETLIGATIYANASQSGTTTNEYGFYSLAIPQGDDSLAIEFSYVGFQSITQKILPKENILKKN